MTLKNEIVHSALIRSPFIMQNKITYWHMHMHTQAQNHVDTLIQPQTKNHSDPCSGRWQTPAFKVITETNESSRLRHSDARAELKCQWSSQRHSL